MWCKVLHAWPTAPPPCALPPSHAHSHDLPSGANILITNTGIAKLADFGCSKVMDEMTTPTASFMDASYKRIKGTVPFMAPEGESRPCLTVWLPAHVYLCALIGIMRCEPIPVAALVSVEANRPRAQGGHLERRLRGD